MDQSTLSLSEGVSAKARKTAERYFGEKAQSYNRDRELQTKWKAEDRALREAMRDLSSGAKVLDIPCGTGRFFPYYRERGFLYWGEDISEDMLAQARKAQRDGENVCRAGDIFNIDRADNAFDAVVCVRFLNLIEPPDVKR